LGKYILHQPSLAGNESKKETLHWSEEQLKNLMTEVGKLGKGPPVTIVSDEIPYPYSHFSIPVGGNGRIGNSLILDPMNKTTKRPMVPELLSIDLPSGVEDMKNDNDDDLPLSKEKTGKASIESVSAKATEFDTDFDDFASSNADTVAPKNMR